ncbi:MAG: cytochrome c [Gemmatimonadetes bacterium]|nr:cytochrome c [Gemmatimonadota bacterium]
MSPRGRSAGLIVALAVAVGACDDQIKRVPIFKTMSWQSSVEAFEETPRTAVPGTMAIDAERTYDLVASDTGAVNPLSGTAGEIARGQELFGQFCAPCHGPTGAGDGSVVGPNRIPAIPLLNLRTELTRGYSDGYLWGMITNGRGLMPAYRRIPPQERWTIVEYLRQLQADAVAAGEIPPLESSSDADDDEESL